MNASILSIICVKAGPTCLTTVWFHVRKPWVRSKQSIPHHLHCFSQTIKLIRCLIFQTSVNKAEIILNVLSANLRKKLKYVFIFNNSKSQSFLAWAEPACECSEEKPVCEWVVSTCGQYSSKNLHYILAQVDMYVNKQRRLFKELSCMK